MRKTKIVATIGPASSDPAVFAAMCKAGVNVARLNFSHGGAADFVAIIDRIRAVERTLARPITIMQDLSGPKIRLGLLPEKPISVSKGMRLLLGPTDKRVAETPYLPFDHDVILESLEPGDRMVLADGGREIRGAYTGDLLSWVMGRGKQDQAWVTIMTNINIVAVATLVDFACIVVAEGAEIGEDVREAARAKGVNLLASPRPAFELCAALAGEADK